MTLKSPDLVVGAFAFSIKLVRGPAVLSSAPLAFRQRQTAGVTNIRYSRLQSCRAVAALEYPFFALRVFATVLFAESSRYLQNHNKSEHLLLC